MNKNNHGFALIQVVIAASIFSFLALAMSRLIVEQREATNYLEDQLEKVQLIRNLETILKDGLSCQQTLQGTVIPAKDQTVKVPSIKDNTGTDVYNSNTTVGSLKIGEITALNQSILAPDSSGFIELEIPISRVRSGGGPSHFKSYKSKISITVDSANQASSCFSPSDLENILKTTRRFEETGCSRTNGILEVTVACGAGYSLLSCSGGPGDLDESHEGWYMVPNFKVNTCRLRVQKPRCVSGDPMTEQRAIAICYQNGK